jgi:hemerythrin superfamily protein
MKEIHGKPLYVSYNLNAKATEQLLKLQGDKKMRIYIKYLLTDILDHIVSNELNIFFDVRTFSDYHQKFYDHILKAHPGRWVHVKDIRVVDLEPWMITK